MIRTVEISPHVLAQGELLSVTCFCDGSDRQHLCPVYPQCKTTGRVTVRTGPKSTAAGRLIERKHK